MQSLLSCGLSAAKAIGLMGWRRLHACAVNHKVQLAVLPGDDKPDPGLDRFSTVSRQDRDALWHYLLEGGAQNALRFLDYCGSLIDGKDKPQEAAPLLESRVVVAGQRRAIAGRNAWTLAGKCIGRCNLFLPRTGAERADAAGRGFDRCAESQGAQPFTGVRFQPERSGICGDAREHFRRSAACGRAQRYRVCRFRAGQRTQSYRARARRRRGATGYLFRIKHRTMAQLRSGIVSPRPGNECGTTGGRRTCSFARGVIQIRTAL